jgi:hypothetical protein
MKVYPYFVRTNLKVRFRGIPLAILTCPGCGRGGLRVPDGRQGKVTCPRCGAEWFHPEKIEISDVEFRCSQNGARFVVQSSRRSPFHKFAIQAIKNAPPRPSKPVDQVGHGAERDLVRVSNGSTARLPRPQPTGLLARLFGGSTAIAPVAEQSLSSEERMNANPVMTRSNYDADQYNWISFICPYCSAKSFVRCAGGHLTCDGTAEIRSGRRFHQCFCGNAGFIEGIIKSIEADQRSIAPADVHTARNAADVGSKEKPSLAPLDREPKDPKTRLLSQTPATPLPDSRRARQNNK